MAKCIVCGTEGTECLCDSCKRDSNIEELCDQVLSYVPDRGENELWDSISSKMSNPFDFRNVVFSLSDMLPTPRKEYRRIQSKVGKSPYIKKDSREWLYKQYNICKSNEGLSNYELNRVKGLVLDSLFKEYKYFEAEDLAGEILESDDLPIQVYETLIEYYNKTRRYDEAEELLNEVKKSFKGELSFNFKKLEDDNNKYRKKAESGQKEYMPNPKENKDEARKRYVEFLATLGIDEEVPESRKKAPKPIPNDEYPAVIETRDSNFNTFVAFDLETTGFSSRIDSIVEIGAIKVVDGKIVESKEFTFQELVRPYKKRISDEARAVHNISDDDVKDAREMWEVTHDFLGFVGDNILVGYNSMRFDSKVLRRAGRYSHDIIKNKHFDVMKYAEGFKGKLGFENTKLETVSNALGIENSNVHRALSDAITTAKVFLKLKDMDNGESDSLDDLLSGFEDL